MSLGGWPLWVGGAVLAFLLWVCFDVWRGRARSKAFSEVAREMGFSFQEAPGRITSFGFSRCSLFKQGEDRQLGNLLQGRFGEIPVMIFDYKYTTGDGEDSKVHRQTVAVFQLAGKTLPDFLLKPENLLHKIGSVFGYKDIDFEESPEFSRRYLLRGDDEKAVRSLFKPWVLSFFEQKPGWSVEGRGPWLVIYRKNKRLNPERFREFWGEVMEFHSRFAMG